MGLLNFGRKKELTPEQLESKRTKDFFDMILPSTIKFLKAREQRIFLI